MTLKKNNFSEMWDTLGIDGINTKSSTWGNKSWPSVITDKGLQRADAVMKDHGFAVDSVAPFAGGYAPGVVNINQINSLAIDNVFLGWGELSILQQNCIINNICTILADSMTEKWIEFKSVDESKRDKIIELEKALLQFNLKELMTTAVYKTILLGTSYISPKLKGDEEDISNPLLISPAKIKKGDLEAIYVIEPTWVVPIEFNMINPRAPNFYKPEAYIVFGQRLDATRMRRMMYIEPVNLISPMYLFGGMPLIQQLLPYILDFLNTKREIVKIVSRFNVSILNTNMNALHGTDAYAKTNTLAGKAKGRAAAFNAVRNNWGLYLLDKEEVFTQMQINTSGLTDILQQQGEFLSLFTRIPVSKLFGQAPRGMNATGEFDSNNYNELIMSIQESKVRPLMEYCINIIQLHLWGDMDSDITFDFVPLGELNETAQSQLKTDKVNRAVSLVQGGLADPVGMMEILQNDPDLGLDDYKQIEDLDQDEEYSYE